jgi:hypothetical protein
VNPDEFPKTLKYIRSKLPETVLWDRFFKYFDATWMDGLFKIKDWNIFGLDDLSQRTNNPLECYNRYE